MEDTSLTSSEGENRSKYNSTIDSREKDRKCDHEEEVFVDVKNNLRSKMKLTDKKNKNVYIEVRRSG